MGDRGDTDDLNVASHRAAGHTPRESLGVLITTRYLELRLRISGWLCLAGAVVCVLLEVRAAVQGIDQPASMLWPAAVLGVVGLGLLRLGRWWATRHPRPSQQR